MTTEVAILNRRAVALAADSAFTVGRAKVNTGNKLFSMSPASDIGVMFFGSADFLGVPWEVLIKTYRQELGDRCSSTVRDCCENFIKYITKDDFVTEFFESLSFKIIITDALEMIERRIPKDTIPAKRDAVAKRIITKTNKSIRENIEEFETSISLKDYRENFLDDSFDLAKDILKVEFKGRPTYEKALSSFIYAVLKRKIESDYSSGIVFAGYGKSQIFPELVCYVVDGKFGDAFRVWEDKENSANLNDGETNAQVIPFAQTDMSRIFMEGMAPNHKQFLFNTMNKVLDEKSKELVAKYVADADERVVETELQKRDNVEIIKGFSKAFKGYIEESMVDPVMGVISTLPKEELAAMAEALVEITSLRRKVDSTLATVGGPTDVALISKGDGLIWIKRKHYFESELNQDFLSRKQARQGGLHEVK